MGHRLVRDRPILAAAAADEARFTGVQTLGVDGHVWHNVSTKSPQDGGRGPKELTGIVDLTVDENGQVRTRLLDLVPCRSKKAYTDWLTQRGGQFRAGLKVATLQPFHGYMAALDLSCDVAPDFAVVASPDLRLRAAGCD